MTSLQYHYESTLRSLWIDRNVVLTSIQLKEMSISTTSRILIMQREQLLRRALMLQLVTSKEVRWTKVRHPVSEFETKRDQVIGMVGEFQDKWIFLNRYLFSISPLLDKQVVRGRNRDYHIGIPSTLLFFPTFLTSSFGSNLHLLFQYDSET